MLYLWLWPPNPVFPSYNLRTPKMFVGDHFVWNLIKHIKYNGRLWPDKRKGASVVSFLSHSQRTIYWFVCMVTSVWSRTLYWPIIIMRAHHSAYTLTTHCLILLTKDCIKKIQTCFIHFITFFKNNYFSLVQSAALEIESLVGLFFCFVFFFTEELLSQN